MLGAVWSWKDGRPGSLRLLQAVVHEARWGQWVADLE